MVLFKMDQENEQPKDYVIETFEEFLENEFKFLTPYQKVVYFLQNHVIKLLLVALAGGYWLGMTYGTFWQ